MGKHEHDHTDLERYRPIYGQVKTIAVVGASNNPTKPSHSIPRYLKHEGFRIIPVNPKEDEILGEKVYRSVSEIDPPVDAVDVFRPAGETPDIAREAAKIGAKVLWLQEGIHNDEAQQIAEDAGLTFVSNRCMGETHWALFHPDKG
jgi:predicted CoA-binding protein